MNNKMIRYIIGYILKLEAGFLILPLFVSFYFKESMLKQGQEEILKQ